MINVFAAHAVNEFDTSGSLEVVLADFIEDVSWEGLCFDKV
jgi:hypothetical protein